MTVWGLSDTLFYGLIRWVEKTLIREAKSIMAKKPETPRQWSDITYLRCELDTKLKADLQTWLKSKHDWLGYIEKEVSNGLRFQVLEDKFHSCFEARLTHMSQSAGINTLVLQGRGPDALSSIQALFFKHYIVLEGQWEELDRPESARYTEWG